MKRISAEGKAPFFSIILPTFNRAHLIGHAIRSVLDQTFQDWELVIIDDGSQDDTFNTVRQSILSNPRIRYHFAANHGLAMARNLGFEMSSGQYLTFIDSDDTYLPLHLEIRAKYVRNHPEVELLHGGVEIIGPDMVADKFDPSRKVSLYQCVIGGTFVIRRDLAERLQGFRAIEYGDDNDFFVRAEQTGAVIHRVDAQTYRYNRLEPDSLCAIVEREGIEGIQAFRGL